MIVDFDGEILIPNGAINNFAVVACDQFSAAPEYWNALKKQLPPLSALDFILPECFLSEADERIRDIGLAAARAKENNRFSAYNGCVFVTRKTAYGRTRRGVVASVDLSDYDYSAGSKTLIRASERTIESRIPPRVKIREALDIELPHILLLIDDPDDLLMSSCKAADKRTVYDGELVGNGGLIKGELITDTKDLYRAVNAVISRSAEKYGERLFALVGDGNHSLATAKYCSIHNPTEYNGRALVEIVNIYDEGLVFEPIHRLVRVKYFSDFVRAFKANITGKAKAVLYTPSPVSVSVPEDPVEAIEKIDAFCEEYVKRNGGNIEYVHGDAALKKIGYVGIQMRGIKKCEFFEHVIKRGVLPKKTFSLGEAEEKRYYIEARKIK